MNAWGGATRVKPTADFMSKSGNGRKIVRATSGQGKNAPGRKEKSVLAKKVTAGRPKKLNAERQPNANTKSMPTVSAKLRQNAVAAAGKRDGGERGFETGWSGILLAGIFVPSLLVSVLLKMLLTRGEMTPFWGW